jgi:hypothetical protein
VSPLAASVSNYAKGAVSEYMRRVVNNDPANSAIVIVALKASGLEAHATLIDYATLADILAASNDEASNANYARKSLTDANLSAPTIDTSGNKAVSFIPDQTWSAVATSGGAWGMLVVCYDSDTTAGTDANIIPLTFHDYSVTPDGSDIVADFDGSSGFHSAS